MLVQILSGLITYLLLAIYCHENYGERVSIRRVSQVRQIQNEARQLLSVQHQSAGITPPAEPPTRE